MESDLDGRIRSRDALEKGEGFTKRKESEIHVTLLTHKIKMGSLGEKTLRLSNLQLQKT